MTSRQPSANVEDRELGQIRAAKLSRITESFVLRRTQEINNQYLPPRGKLIVCKRVTFALVRIALNM